jgi:hypothetical protein
MVPRSRLTDCHTQSQGLRVENTQLKDGALKLRTHNQDLAQRAQDDARRLTELEQANRRLEQSVLAYQEDRDRLVAAFERLRGNLSAAADRGPSASTEAPDLFEALASEHPGLQFDPASRIVRVATDRLFCEGLPELTPAGRKLLTDLSGLLGTSDDLAIHVASGASEPEVRPAGLGTSDADPGSTWPRRGPRPSATPWPGPPADRPSQIALTPPGVGAGDGVEIHLRATDSTAANRAEP